MRFPDLPGEQEWVPDHPAEPNPHEVMVSEAKRAAIEAGDDTSQWESVREIEEGNKHDKRDPKNVDARLFAAPTPAEDQLLADASDADAAGLELREPLIESADWSHADQRLLTWLVGLGSDPAANSRFEPRERAEIPERLERLDRRLNELYALTKEQNAALRSQLEEIREASDHLGRKDWLLLAIGALTALTINAVFQPAAVIHIGKLVIHEVAHLFDKELAGKQSAAAAGPAAIATMGREYLPESLREQSLGVVPPKTFGGERDRNRLRQSSRDREPGS